MRHLAAPSIEIVTGRGLFEKSKKLATTHAQRVVEPGPEVRHPQAAEELSAAAMQDSHLDPAARGLQSLVEPERPKHRQAVRLQEGGSTVGADALVDERDLGTAPGQQDTGGQSADPAAHDDDPQRPPVHGTSTPSDINASASGSW